MIRSAMFKQLCATPHAIAPRLIFYPRIEGVRQAPSTSVMTCGAAEDCRMQGRVCSARVRIARQPPKLTFRINEICTARSLRYAYPCLAEKFATFWGVSLDW